MPKNSILYKLIIIFIVISVLPLGVFAYLAGNNCGTSFLKLFAILLTLLVTALAIVFGLTFIRPLQRLIKGAKEIGKTEHALKNSKQHFQDLLDLAAEGIFQVTPEGNLINANQRMADIFGYESPEAMVNEISNIGLQQYVDPLVREEYVKIVLKQGVVSDFEVKMCKKSGKEICT